MHPRLVLNSRQSPCLSLLGVGITEMSHHAWFVLCLFEMTLAHPISLAPSSGRELLSLLLWIGLQGVWDSLLGSWVCLGALEVLTV